MHYLQEDLAKLTKYAQGLGLKVSVKEYTIRSGDGAGWTTDGTEITLYRWANQTTTRMILNLLHELGHHLSWVYAGRGRHRALEKALYMEDQRTSKRDPVLPKRYRKLIYESEVKDAEYREQIALEVGLRIPAWKIKADKELDIWLYKMYYETGNTPSQKEGAAKYKELKDKYREQS